jgi:hypothetical protein
MAIKVKAKPKQISRSQIKSIDDKAYGPEPIVVEDLTAAYNWYNYMYEIDKAREWLLEHMKKSGFEKAQIDCVKRCSKHKIPTTIGWQARIMMNGNKLSDRSMDYFNQQLDVLFAEGERIKREETVEEAPKPVVDIQARVREKAKHVITNIEEELDLVMDGKQFSMYSFCQQYELTPQIVNIVADYYRPQWEEILSNDEQIKEAYGKRQKFWINFWNEFFNDIDRYVNNKKAVKVRKPREKKVKSAVDQVKNLKYQKEEPTLKIVSVHPAEIVGCSQLWTYNSKYKKLTRYDASGPNGIQVKGTTLTGYDVEKSLSKSLRKPDITIQSLLGAGKVSLRKFMDDLKTVASVPNGRINSDTILLRVIK